MTTRIEKHAELLDRVNGATSEEARRIARAHLRGWREGLVEARGGDEYAMGLLIMEGDEIMLARGIEAPMCGGELL